MENLNLADSHSTYSSDGKQSVPPYTETIVQLTKKAYIQLKWDANY
ncbi:MAG: hypothetical protein ACU88J_02685 [Gammaproteobacteria bacterium]